MDPFRIGFIVILSCIAGKAFSSTLPTSVHGVSEPQLPGQHPISSGLLKDIQDRLSHGQNSNEVTMSIWNKLQLNMLGGKSILNLIMDQAENYLSLELSNLNISSECMGDLFKTVSAATSETWAKRIIDACGKLGSGVLEGNVYWFGSYDECINTIPTQLDQNNRTVRLFTTQYVVTSIPLATLPVGLQWGSCTPSSCTPEDVTTVVKEVLSLLQLDTEGVRTSIKHETFPLDAGAITMICLLSVLLTLLVIATGYDIIVYQPILEQERVQALEVSAENSSPDSSIPADTGVLRADEYTPLLVPKKTKVHADSKNINPVCKLLVKISVYSNAQKLLYTGQTSGAVLGSVHGIRFISMTWVILGHSYFFGVTNMSDLEGALLSISLYQNAQKLLFSKHKSGTLSSVHGLRFLSLCWVILGHTYFFMVLSPLKNITTFYDLVKRPSFQAILNATVSVDTFFFLSGLLVAYLVLREMKEKGGPHKINWLLFYFHRIWRLTPPYMLILGAYTTLYKYFGNGPAWPGDVPEAHCKDNWWTNLLYINNIVHKNNGCMMWTWYLANDMQFYIISPIILVPLYYHFGAGLAVTLVIMLISFITTGVISVQNSFPPSTAAITLYLPKLISFFQKLYLVPWTRIGPYLIGILVGYILYRTDRKVSMKWYTVTIGWMLAAGCNLLILYGLYGVANGDPISDDASALYNSVHRTIWACGVGWVIFACVTGHGGPVNKLLSWPALIPLSRLTYMAYLIHPIIMEWFYQSSKNPFYLDDTTIIYLFLGHLVMSYSVAFVLSLAFEAPMLGIEKFIFKR